MKLLVSFALSALAGLAAASSKSDPAEVYMFRTLPSESSTHVPVLSREVARLILTQRLGSPSEISSLSDGINYEDAIAYINKFGKAPQPLFEESSSEPAQLVVILEGSTAESAKLFKNAAAAFTIQDPPSTQANEALVSPSFYGDVTSKKCPLDKAIDPSQEACWSGKEKVLRYDLTKQPKIAKTLKAQLGRIESLARDNKMETVILLIPESSRSTGAATWAAPVDELRKRQKPQPDQVVVDRPSSSGVNADVDLDSDSFFHIWSVPNKTAHIPSCFQSFNACMTATGGCSSHGRCVDRFSGTGATNCFACQCLATLTEGGEQTTHWGGSMCQKQDVSVPFWLLAGFTIVMVGAVTFSIGLLYSVGEEKLPGVIGAGVSRATK